MSCLQNEIILENIYEEILDKCYQRGLHLWFGSQELEQLAADLTQQRFDRIYD